MRIHSLSEMLLIIHPSMYLLMYVLELYGTAEESNSWYTLINVLVKVRLIKTEFLSIKIYRIYLKYKAENYLSYTSFRCNMPVILDQSVVQISVYTKRIIFSFCQLSIIY